MSRIFLSAAHKSSGKTCVTTGLCAAFASRKLHVQTFKKGPDYIDPIWLSMASGRPCYNLDFYTMERDELHQVFHSNAGLADISVIEGNKGLYDGLDLDGSNSNAELAKQLNTPVILVLDARGMTRGIAPLILGYQQFDTSLNIAGVIINQLGGSRHESKLRNVIEHYTDVEVVGAIHHDQRFDLEERHLGLIPGNEDNNAQEKISQLQSAVNEQTNIDRILDIANLAAPLPSPDIKQYTHHDTSLPLDITIGVFRNSAFGFYYPGDLEMFEQCGARLLTIDAISDSRLPEVDGLFIGGGFPETHMMELEQNATLRADIYEAIDKGLPAYAECGGLMYLSRSINWQGKCARMCGAIGADAIMCEKPQGRGYTRLMPASHHPWYTDGCDSIHEIAAHEFHYSRLENLDRNLHFAYRVTRGSGIDGKNDGIIHNNLLASYTHMRHTRTNPWVQQFVNFSRRHKHAIQ